MATVKPYIKYILGNSNCSELAVLKRNGVRKKSNEYRTDMIDIVYFRNEEFKKIN